MVRPHLTAASPDPSRSLPASADFSVHSLSSFCSPPLLTIESVFPSLSQNDAFASTSHLLKGTMRRMTTMAKNQGGRWCWFMLFLMFCCWIFVVMWFFRR